MTLSYDPISVFEAVGYTEREAVFLYLTAVHSGYFLRRQYVRFIQRGRGALAEQLLRRASALGHIQSVACGQSRFVYHLHASAIYEAAGLAALRHRRLKGDASIKLRLMVLDFVLDHLDDSMLDTRESKVSHFTGALGLDKTMLPSIHGSPFADDFPVLLGDPLRFTFFDEGALSSSAFEKFLGRYRRVFDALPGLALLYIADSAQNAERGRSVFEARFSSRTTPGPSPLAPRGVSHLLDYLAARDRVSSPSETPTLRELALLHEGESIYTAPEHASLLAEWQGGEAGTERVLRRLRQQRGPIEFHAITLPYSYPLHHFRRERQEVSDLRSSEGSIKPRLFEP